MLKIRPFLFIRRSGSFLTLAYNIDIGMATNHQKAGEYIAWAANSELNILNYQSAHT